MPPLRQCPACESPLSASGVYADVYCSQCGEPLEGKEIPASAETSNEPTRDVLTERLKFEEAVPEYSLFAPSSVGSATILGGIFGGSFIMAMNYRRVGNGGAAIFCAVFGLIVAMILTYVMWSHSLETWVILFALFRAMIMAAVGSVLQGDLYRKHVSRGGTTASGWGAFGIGLLCGVFALAAFNGVMSLRYRMLGNPVTVGPGQTVYYREGVTEDEARKLARYLQQKNLFQHLLAIQIKKNDKGLVVTFVQFYTHFGPAHVRDYKEIGRKISENVLGGKLVEIRICDRFLVTRRVISIKRLQASGARKNGYPRDVV